MASEIALGMAIVAFIISIVNIILVIIKMRR
jgi:hypothetical protein